MNRVWRLSSVCSHHTATTLLSLMTISGLVIFHSFFLLAVNFFNLSLERTCDIPYFWPNGQSCLNGTRIGLWLACFQTRMCSSPDRMVFHGACFPVGWRLFNFRNVSHCGRTVLYSFLSWSESKCTEEVRSKPLWSGKWSDFPWLYKQKWFILLEMAYSPGDIRWSQSTVVPGAGRVLLMPSWADWWAGQAGIEELIGVRPVGA